MPAGALAIHATRGHARGPHQGEGSNHGPVAGPRRHRPRIIVSESGHRQEGKSRSRSTQIMVRAGPAPRSTNFLNPPLAGAWSEAGVQSILRPGRMPPPPWKAPRGGGVCRPLQRLENWKRLRAPGWPYFLRSFSRASRVKSPSARNTGRRFGSTLRRARAIPSRIAPA